jgi:F-type H+-transporting ATPase subunit b
MDYTQSEYLVPIFDYGVLHLELNTALFILFLFLIAMFLLNRLLFRPVLRTLDQRAALVNGIREDNARKQHEIARLTEEYEARMEEIRSEIDQFRQKARRESGRQAEAILTQARRDAEERLGRSMGELEREIARLRAEVLRGAGTLAEQITVRILER